MHLQEFFVTRAGQAGLLQGFTKYILIVMIFSFAGMTIFSLATKDSVAPEHRTSSVLTAITVTTWGVCPIGYLAPTLFPETNLNWLHIAFPVADVYNKVGLGIVAYLAAAKIVEKMVSKEEVRSGCMAG